MRTGVGFPAWVARRWLILRSGHVTDTFLLLPLCAGFISWQQQVQASQPAAKTSEEQKVVVSSCSSCTKVKTVFSEISSKPANKSHCQSKPHTHSSSPTKADGAPSPPPSLGQRRKVTWGHTPEPNQFSLEGQRAGNQERFLRPITPQTFLRFSPSTSNILCLLRKENGENTERGGKNPQQRNSFVNLPGYNSVDFFPMNK